ncbi:MAG: serine/threonine-protein kinase [Nannocystaceae bacterium]|nr:serine/threonine-protein kinase [Nannocystaceae bacterium]
MKPASPTTGAKLRALAPAPAADRVAQQLRQRVRAALTGRHEPIFVGRYELGERVGAGGMGTVFRAHDPVLDRAVALKLIALPDPELRESLLREAQAMADVEHARVVEVYDVGATDDEVFIVMRLVEGETLRAWMRREPSYEVRMRVLIEAGHGLAAAHARGVVHHDFKPENVLVERSGHAVVIDFGLATLAQAETHSWGPEGNTSERVLGGTRGYAAPERHAGLEGDAKCDQYSWCATAVEVLYGVVPSPSLTRLNALGLPEVGRVPPRVRAALERGLQEAPTARFESLDGLLKACSATRSRTWVALATLLLVAVAFGLWPGRTPPDADRALARAGLPPLGLYARFTLARAWLAEPGHVPETVSLFEEVFASARAQHQPRVATRAATTLVSLHHRPLGDVASARRWAQLGESAWLDGGGDLDAGALYYNLADVETDTGQLERGRELFERALAYDLGEHGPAHRDVLATALALVNLDMLQGDFEAAEARLTSTRSYIPEEDVELRVNAEGLGAALATHHGRYGAALQGLFAVVELHRPGGGIPLGYALSNASRVMGIVGRHEEARSLAAEALETIEAAAGSMSVQLAPALSQLAQMNWKLGAMDAARSHAWRAIVVLESDHGSDDLALAGPLYILGGIASAQGRHTEAASVLERSLQIRRTHGSRPAAVAASLVALARALEHDEPVRARALAGEAIALLEASGGDSTAARATLAGLGGRGESGTLRRAQ